MAQRLGIPLVTYAQNIKIQNGKAIVERQLEDGYEVIETPLPCLITAVKELNTPRYMSAKGIIDAYEKEIHILNHNDIELPAEKCGLEASPTRVVRSFAPELKGKGEILEGTPKEISKNLVLKLKEKNIL